MSMVAQGYGITLASEAAAQASFPGVVFRPVLDEPEPITFSALWSPHNRSQALLHLLRACATEIRGQIIGNSMKQSAAPLQRPDLSK